MKKGFQFIVTGRILKGEAIFLYPKIGWNFTS